MPTRREVLVALLGGLMLQRPLVPQSGEMPPEPGGECRNPTAFYWCVQIYGSRCMRLPTHHARAACLACVVAVCYARWC